MDKKIDVIFGIGIKTVFGKVTIFKAALSFLAHVLFLLNFNEQFFQVE